MSLTIARRASIGVAVLVLVASGAFAQRAKHPKNDTQAADQQVRAAQQEMLQAAIQGDRDGVAKYVSDDITWTGSNGRVLNKDQILGMLPAPVHNVDVQQVLSLGNTAILTGVAHLKDGTDSRYLQEWVKQDGQWKLFAHEGTPVNEGAPATAMTGTNRPTETAGTAGTSASEAPNVEPTLTTDEERAVWRAQSDIVDAYDQGDTSRYSRLTANDFTRIETKGQVYNRRQWLDLVHKNAKQPLKRAAISDVQVNVDKTNNVARVTLQMAAFGPDGNQLPPERQTRIFALRNGEWQQVAAISTPVTELLAARQPRTCSLSRIESAALQLANSSGIGQITRMRTLAPERPTCVS